MTGYNHYPDCGCGWCVKGRAAERDYYMKLIADGSIWSSGNLPRYESFVDPNAKCPVCGEPVFFYKSPYGGRVFFDSLGPPWPKHPCTDNLKTVMKCQETSLSRSSERLYPAFGGGQKYSRYQWRPLIYTYFKRGDIDIISPERYDSYRYQNRYRDFEGDFLFLPLNSVGSSPMFWRWSDICIGFIEISIMLDKEERFLVPSFVDTLSDFKSAEANDMNPTPAQLSRIAHWARAQAKMAGSNKANMYEHYEAAIKSFEQALELDPNNDQSPIWLLLLGHMYRDGLGCEVNPEKAFKFLFDSVKIPNKSSAEDISDLYRKGFGTPINLDKAKFFYDLSKTLPDW